VIVAGIHEGEFQDRAYLSLPGHQEELIQAVAATGKRVVVLLVGGSAITMQNWMDKVGAIAQLWYPGEQGGLAVADLLSGRINPAGRLPITFPVHEAQLPLTYYHKPTGRGDDYHNLSGEPLFPFGYGLSYTEFKYSNLRLLTPTIGSKDTAVIQCVVTNVGPVAGEEVVQLYIRDELASLARPVMQLKGFERISLLKGESRTVKFRLPASELAFLNQQLETVLEPGSFRIMIGASSRDIRLKGDLELK
jgi:beta-glucosidase